MKFSSELLKGATKNLILSVLSEREMYGYEIVKTIREKSDDLLTLGEGSVYPALHELEKRQYLKSYWMEQEGVPDRKYYTITKKGKKAHQDAMKEWSLFQGAVNKVYKIS